MSKWCGISRTILLRGHGGEGSGVNKGGYWGYLPPPRILGVIPLRILRVITPPRILGVIPPPLESRHKRPFSDLISILHVLDYHWKEKCLKKCWRFAQIIFLNQLLQSNINKCYPKIVFFNTVAYLHFMSNKV